MKRLVVMLTICCVAFGVLADDWPQWRGPAGDGVSLEKGWSPQAVSAGKILWKKGVGTGYSSVTVVKEHVFMMGNVGEKDEVVCLNATDGSEVWKHSYPCGSPEKLPGPRCTPAVDASSSSVYVLSREGELYCLDAAKGDVKWKKNVKDEFGAKEPKWAFSSSPIVVGDMLLINEGAKGIALNKKTGAKIWAGGPGGGGYSSPVVYTKGGKQYAVMFSAKNAYGVDGQAGDKNATLKCVDFKTGAEKWSQNTGFGSIFGVDGKILFLGEAGKLLVAEMSPAGYKELASTQLTMKGKCWTLPILAYGRIYCRSEGGDLLCVDVRK